MLSVAEAQERVLAAFEALEPVSVLVADALGLTLAEDLHAPHPLPRFDNSAMDGYAVLAEDTAEATEGSPVELRLAGEVRAGSVHGSESVGSGTAVRIMTGAPVPPGADAIVPVEVTEESGDLVKIKEPTETGRHVRPAGDDVEEGQLVVAAGSELGPGELALIASLGLSPVTVRPRPRVAILVTGDELVTPEEDPGPGQIRDSNSIALRALVREAGAEPLLMPHVPDDRAATLDAFKWAAEDTDLVVSSGGVAVGRYDFVKEVVEELGGIDMWRVAMQPGKPVVLGSLGEIPFLGLPGNPVSIHVSFEQFVRPAIRKMRGCTTLFRPMITATLTETIEKRPGRLHFVRVRLEADGHGWRATPTGPQGSHIQSSLVGTHGVALFGKDLDRLEEGSPVVVQVWDLPGVANV
jgi:molybdopterin molybdotransferase